MGTSLVVQWLGICLVMQGTLVRKRRSHMPLSLCSPKPSACCSEGLTCHNKGPTQKNEQQKKRHMYPVNFDTCTKLIAALFTIARTWKQPRHPMTDEWIKKLWYMYTMEYYLAIKKEHVWATSNEVMYLEPIFQSVSKSEKQISSIYTYIWNLERWDW